MNKGFQEMLKTTTIAETSPGSIIADFEMMLDDVAKKGIPLTGKTKHIAMGQLKAINDKMTTPLETGLSRPQQLSYPNINGIYMLLRNSGIVKVQKNKKKNMLVINDAGLETWHQLNLAEKYFSLFKLFLTTSHEITLERGTHLKNPLGVWRAFFKQIKPGGLKIKGNSDLEDTLGYSVGYYMVSLMGLFGIVDIVQEQVKAGEKWMPVSVKKTPFGEALLAQCLKSIDMMEYILLLGEPDYGKDPNTFIRDMVKETFTEVKDLLSPEAVTYEFQDGLYTYKVSLYDSNCLMIIPAKVSWKMFAESIMDAFKFENDHLYMFRFEDCFGEKISISHDAGNDPDSYSVSENRIGDFLINEGDEIEFVFDYGDWWEFKIEFISIGKPDKRVKKPKVTDFKGTPPEQYPYDEEDEFY